jgi:hypothetical protein
MLLCLPRRANGARCASVPSGDIVSALTVSLLSTSTSWSKAKDLATRLVRQYVPGTVRTLPYVTIRCPKNIREQSED